MLTKNAQFLKIIRPEFFDIFGVFVFAFLVVLSLFGLKYNKPFPRWSFYVLFFIGIFGFAIDGIIVYMTYLR
jgi:uncharacterized membrane protein